MFSIVTIAGSPSHPSRSAALLDYARHFAEERGASTSAIIVRNLNAEELIQGQFNGASIQASVKLIASADGVIIATPVYKASYTGVLKTFLDVLPAAAFAGKTVLPIAMGGSWSHMLVLDYALKPVLFALGAQNVLNGVYLLDNQIEYTNDTFRFVDPEAEQRTNAALDTLITGVQK
jgi:FMN reductase